jgi:hypothetical protein
MKPSFWRRQGGKVALIILHCQQIFLKHRRCPP